MNKLWILDGVDVSLFCNCLANHLIERRSGEKRLPIQELQGRAENRLRYCVVNEEHKLQRQCSASARTLSSPFTRAAILSSITAAVTSCCVLASLNAMFQPCS